MHPIGASFWNAGPKIRGAFLGGEAFDVFLLAMGLVSCGVFFLGGGKVDNLTDTLQVQLVKAQWWDLPLLTEAELVHFGFLEFLTNPCQKMNK